MKKKNKEQKNLEQIGALWVRESKFGKEYLSGIIDGREVVIFENKFRKEEKHPYWIIFTEK